MSERDVYAENLAVYKHEAETPPRGHDEDGRCCFLARFAAMHEGPAQPED